MHRIGSRYRIFSGEQRHKTRRRKSPWLIESLETRHLMSATPVELSEYLTPATTEFADVSPSAPASSLTMSGTPVASSLAPQGLLASGMPLGNYVMLPTRGNIFVPSGALGDPDIAGFVVRDTWSNVNPAPGVYNWSRIDAAINKITAAGKSFKLAIYTGMETPSWVYDAGAQSMQFYESGGNRATGWYTMPVPWDGTMLQSYTTLLGALSARYSANPQLTMVELGGPTRFSIEMHLPEEVLNYPGYSSTKVVDAWTTVLNGYRSVFPNTYGSIALANPIPGVSNGVAAQVAANAVSILGPRAALQHNAMSAKSSLLTYNIHQLVSQYGAQGVMVGYEEVAPSKDARFGGSFATAWQRVLAGSGKFFDIYVPDDAVAQPFPGLSVNQPPRFTKGPNISTTEDVGTFLYPAWATGISAGSTNETGQVLTFEVTANSNPGLFSVTPSIDPLTGTLRFTTATNAYGTAKVTFVLRDSGGTAHGGVNVSPSATLTIAVGSMNDAPRLDISGSPALNSINQNPPNNNGTMISSLLSTAAGGNPISDVDVGSRRGIAIVGADTANGSWQYSLNGGSSWLTLGSPSSAAARLLVPDSLTKIRFVPNSNFVGAAQVYFRAWDQTTGTSGGLADTSLSGGNSAFSTAIETASISVLGLIAQASLAPAVATTTTVSKTPVESESRASTTSTIQPGSTRFDSLSPAAIDRAIAKWNPLDDVDYAPISSLRRQAKRFLTSSL